jgi:MFS transporter, FHS family, L-fucose permease
MGATVATAFGFTKLPETSEAELQAQVNLAAEASGRATHLDRPFYRLPRPFFGFLAQFLYVGAQVTIGAFFVNYVTESVGWSNARASTFLSYS